MHAWTEINVTSTFLIKHIFIFCWQVL